MKLFLSVAVLIAFSQNIYSQNLHLNLFAGTTNYRGDLQDQAFSFSQAHLAGGAGLSYDLTDHFALRGGILVGKVSAHDKFGHNKSRNLQFASLITEGQLGIEYYITPLLEHSLTPYVFLSGAVYHYNPYTFDTAGTKYFLSPLSTEGQGIVDGRNPYKLTQFAIPFGGGVKLSLSDNVNVGVEMGFRKLFTDYLDDVSTTYIDHDLLLSKKGAKAVELSYRGDELKNGVQSYPSAGKKRGNPVLKDWYYFTGATISFRLNGGGLGRYSPYRCPGNVL